MASALIPLQVRQPQIETPIEQAQQGMGLVGLAQQAVLNRQRIQEETIKAQNAAQDQRDQQTVQQAWLSNGGDWDKTRSSVLGKVRMQTIQQMDADHQKVQQSALEAARQDVLNKTEKTNQIVAHNKLIGQEAAALDVLPDADKPAAWQGALTRLQAAGVDVSTLPPTIPPDGSANLAIKHFAAAAGYAGEMANDALKKARAEAAQQQAVRAKQAADSAAMKEQAAIDQQDMEKAARAHLAIAALPPEQQQAAHEQWLANLPDNIKGNFAGFQKYSQAVADTIQKVPLTAQQRATGQMTEEARDIQRQRAEQQDRMADIRQQLADQQRQLTERRLTDLENKQNVPPGSKPLTSGQVKVEERSIANEENGTATRPGLHRLRLEIGQQLQSNVNAKGDEQLNTDQRAALAAKLQAVTNQVQTLQYRKAKLYGIAPPDPEQVGTAKDGESVQAEDGSIWKKKDGVAYYAGAGGQEPPTPPVAKPPAPQTKPIQTPPVAGTPTPPAKNPNDIVSMKTPDGKYVTGKRSQIEAWMKANGLTYAEK